MRRLLLVLFGSAVLLSACGSSKATPAPATPAPATPATPATQATTATPGATPTDAPTVVETSTPVVLVAPINAGVDGDWVTLAPAAAGFTAKFPVMPTLTTQTATTAVGDARASLWTYEQGGNLAYYVQVTNYPTGSLASANPVTLYDAAIQSMTGGTSQLTLAGETDLTLGGHAGRLFLLTSALGSLKGGVWIAGDVMYMVYVSFTSSVDPGLIDTFLSDFQLTV